MHQTQAEKRSARGLAQKDAPAATALHWTDDGGEKIAQHAGRKEDGDSADADKHKEATVCVTTL